MAKVTREEQVQAARWLVQHCGQHGEDLEGYLASLPDAVLVLLYQAAECLQVEPPSEDGCPKCGSKVPPITGPGYVGEGVVSCPACGYTETGEVYPWMVQ